MKCLGINFIKNIQDLYTGIRKHWEKIKDYIKGELSVVIDRLNIVKTSMIPHWLTVYITSIKILVHFSVAIGKQLLKLAWKCTGLGIARATLKGDRIGRPARPASPLTPLTPKWMPAFDKGAKATQWGKDSLQQLEQLNTYNRNTEFWSIPPNLHKNSLNVDHRPKCKTQNSEMSRTKYRRKSLWPSIRQRFFRY